MSLAGQHNTCRLSGLPAINQTGLNLGPLLRLDLGPRLCLLTQSYPWAPTHPLSGEDSLPGSHFNAQLLQIIFIGLGHEELDCEALQGQDSRCLKGHVKSQHELREKPVQLAGSGTHRPGLRPFGLRCLYGR